MNTDRRDGEQSQPLWTVAFDEDDGSDAARPSRFVEVTVTYRMQVTDLALLQEAVAARSGTPDDDLDRQLRQAPANLVGLALGPPPRLPHLPGVTRPQSSLAVAEYDPEP